MTPYKHLLDNPKYVNYRCRKCNQFISKKVLSTENLMFVTRNSAGVTISNEYNHPNCIIEDSKVVFCDLVSTSDHQIKDSYILLEEKYDEQFIDYKKEE